MFGKKNKFYTLSLGDGQVISFRKSEISFIMVKGTDVDIYFRSHRNSVTLENMDKKWIDNLHDTVSTWD